MSLKKQMQGKGYWLKRGWLLLGLFAVVLGASQWSCAPARLDLNLYYPVGQDGKAVYDKITRFSIAMRGESLTAPAGDDSNEFEPSENKSRVLPDVKCRPKKEGETPKIEIEVLGIDGQGKSFASGRSILFHECGKPLKVSLFMSPVGRFSTLTSFHLVTNGAPFTQAAAMDEKRAGHRVALLPDGRLLITGGAEISGLGKITAVSGTTEIYNPTTGIFTKGPSLSVPRAFHTMTQVENSIVVIGGLGLQAGKVTSVRNVDVFALNSAGKLVRRDGPALTEGRAFHTATAIGTTSNLLVFGGVSFQPTSGSTTMATQWEIVDYTKDEVVSKGPIVAVDRRAMHSSSRLEATGQILLAGGIQINSQGKVNTLDSMLSVSVIAESGEPRAVRKVLSEKLKAPRAAHSATILENKSVLIAGGMVARSDNLFVPQTVVGTMEIFASNGERQGGQLTMTQPRVFHSTQRLNDGRVVLFGGLQSVSPNLVAKASTIAEIYSPDPTNGIRSRPQEIPQRKDRFMQAATLLLNGSLVVIGGVAVPSVPAAPYATLNRGEAFNPGPKNK